MVCFAFAHWDWAGSVGMAGPLESPNTEASSLIVFSLFHSLSMFGGMGRSRQARLYEVGRQEDRTSKRVGGPAN